MIKSLFTISRNELQRIFRTPAIISVMCIGLIIYFFFYPQPYLNESVRDIPVAVIDKDHTHSSRELIRQLDANQFIKIAYHLDDMETAKSLVDKRKIYGIVLIPSRFEQQILAGKSSAISYYGDASYILIYSNTATAINTIASNFGAKISINRKIAQGVDPAVANSNTTPFSTQLISLFNPQSGYATYVIPAAFILILHQTLLIGCILCSQLGRESSFELSIIRQQNDALKSALMMIIGKLMTYLPLYLFYFIIYTVVANYWYNLPRIGSFTDSLLFAIPFILSVALLARICSRFIRTIDDIFCLLLPISILIFFTTGLSWPKELMPSMFHYIGSIIPAIPAIVGSVKINQMGATFSEFSSQYWHLWLLTIVYFILALISEYYYHKKALITLSKNI